MEMSFDFWSWMWPCYNNSKLYTVLEIYLCSIVFFVQFAIEKRKSYKNLPWIVVTAWILFISASIRWKTNPKNVEQVSDTWSSKPNKFPYKHMQGELLCSGGTLVIMLTSLLQFSQRHLSSFIFTPRSVHPVELVVIVYLQKWKLLWEDQTSSLKCQAG